MGFCRCCVNTVPFIYPLPSSPVSLCVSSVRLFQRSVKQLRSNQVKCFGSRDAEEILVRLWIHSNVRLSYRHSVFQTCHCEKRIRCVSVGMRYKKKHTDPLRINGCMRRAAASNSAGSLRSSGPLDDRWIFAVFMQHRLNFLKFLAQCVFAHLHLFGASARTHQCVCVPGRVSWIISAYLIFRCLPVAPRNGDAQLFLWITGNTEAC